MEKRASSYFSRYTAFQGVINGQHYIDLAGSLPYNLTPKNEDSALFFTGGLKCH